MKKRFLDKIEEFEDKLLIGNLCIFFFPAVIAHKMHGGKLKLNRDYSKTSYFVSDNLEIRDPVKGESDKEIDYGKISQEKVREAVKIFSTTLLNNFSPDALINLYKNINNTKITNDGRIIYFINNVIKGYCDSTGFFMPKSDGEEQTIEVLSSRYLYHELFHAATYVPIDENTHIVGFSQHTKIEDGVLVVGDAINEGYTELMSHRYFPSKVGETTAYKKQIELVEKIEKIIGKEKMENFYLTANLKGLIEEFSKYCGKEKVRELIAASDVLLRNIPMTYNERKRHMIKMCESLVLAFSEKQRLLLESKEIDENQYRQSILDYIDSFPKDEYIDGKIYPLDSQLINNTIRVLNNPIFKIEKKEEGYSR